MVITINDPKLEARLTEIAESKQKPVPALVHGILLREAARETPARKAGAPAAKLVQKGSYLVIAGDLPRDYDISAEIEAAREERERKILGL